MLTIASDLYHVSSSLRLPPLPRLDSALVRRLKLERSNDGGGVSIRGFFVSTGCYVVMFVMAVLFLVFGVTLLAVSYRKVDEEEMEQKAQSSESVVSECQRYC